MEGGNFGKRWISQNTNSNNSNNPKDYSFHHGGSKDNEFDELGEIHPQTTTEGYGLRTPYGTHFNLDFMKYCQNFAGQEPDSRSSSGRSSSISSDSRPELSRCDGIENTSGTKTTTETTLWETRRRLDAFRSFRKNKSSPIERRQYNQSNEVLTQSPGSSSTSDLKLSDADSSSPTLRNSPVQPQNLQTVREQMATALNRLKYLENEAKQIPILKVQISVLKQEKRKMTAQIKAFHDKNTKNNSRPSTDSSPPAPPQRRYKSVAVGTADDIQPKLDFSNIHVENYDPKSEVEEDIATSNSTQQTQSQDASAAESLTCETVQPGDIKHPCSIEENSERAYTFSVITTDEKSTYFCPESSDFSANVFIPGQDVGSQASCMQLNSATSTSSLVARTVEGSTNTELLTADKASICHPDTSDFACVAKIFGGVDAHTNTEYPVIENVATEDKSTFFCPESSDFGFNAHILGQDVSLQVSCHQMDHATSTESFAQSTSDQFTSTEWLTLDKASSFHPVMSDFSCNVKVYDGVDSQTNTNRTALHDAFTNTNVVSSDDFSIQVRPSMSDYGATVFPAMIDASVSVNVLPITSEAGVQFECEKSDVFTSTECVVVNNHTNTELIITEDSGTQIQPSTADVSIDNAVQMVDASVSIELDHDGSPIYDKFTQTEHVPVDNQDIARPLMCNVATDTLDLNSTLKENEIGTYVGKVESLLDEQQSLLAKQYQNFEIFHDRSEIPIKAVYRSDDLQRAPPKAPSDIDKLVQDKRYILPCNVRDACEVIALGLRSGDNFDVVPWADAIEPLRKEWFVVSASSEPNPDNIKDFAAEIRSVSPNVLSQVINSLDETGNSSLHYAVSHENFKVIVVLVDIPELNVNQYNKAGYTASMLASITQIKSDFDSKAVAKLFQRADVGLHAKQAGQTALMLAVSHGCFSSAKLLLIAGADVNAQDEDGSTALMCATEHGHIELVKLLLSQPDCDPTIQDGDGSTAINIAMDSGQRDIGMLLYVHLNLDKSEDS